MCCGSILLRLCCSAACCSAGHSGGCPQPRPSNLMSNIVRREIQAHIPEDFWHIHVTHTGPDHKACEFGWDRGRLFDHTAATILYELCVEQPLATVTQVTLVSSVHCPTLVIQPALQVAVTVISCAMSAMRLLLRLLTWTHLCKTNAVTACNHLQAIASQ